MLRLSFENLWQLRLVISYTSILLSGALQSCISKQDWFKGNDGPIIPSVGSCLLQWCLELTQNHLDSHHFKCMPCSGYRLRWPKFSCISVNVLTVFQLLLLDYGLVWYYQDILDDAFPSWVLHIYCHSCIKKPPKGGFRNGLSIKRSLNARSAAVYHALMEFHITKRHYYLWIPNNLRPMFLISKLYSQLLNLFDRFFRRIFHYLFFWMMCEQGKLL